MNAKLSTHVLDLTTGKPAAGMLIELHREGATVKSEVADAEGRAVLLHAAEMVADDYELVFHLGAYFDQTAFLDRVPVRFRITDPEASYHIPLLCTPWSYSTYRGS
jgi:hydroxyisourate hydrolase